MAEDKSQTSSPNCLARVSQAFVSSLERFFYWHGRSVAGRPVLYIGLCFIVTAICCLGFANFYMETRPEKLWIPQDSDYVAVSEWQAENFPNDQRIEIALYQAQNVLTPVVVQEMYRVFDLVRNLTVEDQWGRTLSQEDLCYKIPVVNQLDIAALAGQSDDDGRPQRGQARGPKLADTFTKKDWSLTLDSSIFCGVRSKIPEGCLQLGLLDIWGDNKDLIYSLTQQDIINDVNTVTTSATYMYPMDFTQYLGKVERNSSDHIVGAGATLHQWVMLINRTALDLTEQAGTMGGLNTEVDQPLYDWEGEFIGAVLDETDRPQQVDVYITTERSFGEISGDTIVGDVLFLALGNAILFIYVTVMLGKFNFVEQRPLLSLLGLLSTFMAIGIAFGLCSAMGLDYGPVHSILPLLMLGLGVDDMFVIVQCWSNLPPKEVVGVLVPEQMARALQHAGVAITVTSLTDVIAFAIGATTVLPALRSFCIYSAVGILALYLLQATFFVAWFTLDQQRMNENRNGLLWCYTHKDYQPSSCSKVNLAHSFFDKIYSKYLLSKPGKIVALSISALLLAVSIWGVTELRQEFNPVWFLPQSSYLFQFLSKIMEDFPNSGTRGLVYLGELDYPAELPKIDQLTKDLLADPDVASVYSWYTYLVDYTKEDLDIDISGQALNETFFNSILSKFLYSSTGSRFQSYFNFEGNISCGEPVPNIIASKFDFQHGSLVGSAEQIDAMDRVKDIVNAQDFSDFAAPIAMMYSSWETDKVIAAELIRNLSLALAAVLVMTLLLLANLTVSICVFLCVAITLVEVMALMTWWGLTIDTVSCINLVLCIGLCVDYSVHIGLHFLQVQGSRDERVKQTLTQMAPAVLNGAFSTFLAFILLANSDSHVFLSFFKIFFGVFLFGVWQGLVFLPVVLSLVGPAPYQVMDYPPHEASETVPTLLDKPTSVPDSEKHEQTNL